jgi:PDDEXK-like domain of unknown function (DUF3799)
MEPFSMLPAFAPDDFENNWITDLSNEDYHADKSTVSSSALRTILKSPATFYSTWMDVDYKEPSDALHFGNLVHMAILEPKKFFQRYVKMPDFGDQRTKKNKEAKEEYMSGVSPHAILVTEKEHARLECIINSVLAHKDASALLKNGQSEISGFYKDPKTGLKCRIRPDFMNFEIMCMVDLKTTIDCSLDAFSKSIWNYRYDFQLGMYCEGIREITGRSINHAVLLAIEKNPPFEVALYHCDDSVLAKGVEDYHRALSILSECIKKNQWPAYQTSMQSIQLPRWALSQI